MAGDEAAALEEPEQVVRVGCRETIVHIGFAAQLDRRGKTGVRDREAVAEMGAQLPPGHGAGFVERIAAAVAGQHDGPASQLRRQIHRVRPQFVRRIHVHQRFEIAVQIEDEVGVDRHAQQCAAQFLEIVRRA